MNHEVEQDHYLGAQGFMSPCHWLQGAKPGPDSPVLQGGGKYAGWEGWHLALLPFHAERKESRQWQDYVCHPGFWILYSTHSGHRTCATETHGWGEQERP